MILIEFRVKGLRALTTGFRAALSKLIHRLEPTTLQVATLYRDTARQFAPVGQYYDRYGNPVEPPWQRLRDSIQLQPTVSLGRMMGYRISVVMARHGLFTINPVKPHPIFPSSKRALAFYWVNAPGEFMKKRGLEMGRGAYVILPSVKHPGYTPPTPTWPERTWQAIEPRAREIMGKPWQDMVNEVRGYGLGE